MTRQVLIFLSIIFLAAGPALAVPVAEPLGGAWSWIASWLLPSGGTSPSATAAERLPEVEAQSGEAADDDVFPPVLERLGPMVQPNG